jgi:hypothetical protein
VASPEPPFVAATLPAPTDSLSPVASEIPVPLAEPANEPKPAPAGSPQPRASKANQRRGDDWLTAHGKYIALGFVLALVVTIYLARSNRGTPAQPVASAHAHPGEAANQPAKAAERKEATVVSASTSPANAKAKAKASQAAETSPAKLAEASPVKPQTDLHPPTTPQLVREPAPQPRADGLFPWADPAEDRLASRETPPAPPSTDANQHRYPVTNPNAALPPNYPPLTPPANAQPAPGYAPPGGAYPGTNQSAGFGPQPWNVSPPPSPVAGAPPYQPQDNTARDYRYERTGSGPY